MEYSLRGRKRKVDALIFRIIPRIIFYKCCAPFLLKKSKQKLIARLHLKTANELVDAFMQLEGLFLKVGQLISTFSSILPKPYVEAFEKTQNHSTIRPFEEIKTRIEAELKMTVESVFLWIDEEPLGTASIGQVHKGVLKDGADVAIKVQHLNIETIAALDLQLIKKVLKLVQVFISIKGIDTAFAEIEAMIHEELDYEHEAEQMQAIAKNLVDDIRIIIPAVYEEYSTKKVLVLEYLDGQKITNKEFAEKYLIDQTLLAEHLLDIFSKNIFLDGLYHADPHPGNVLVNTEGQILLLDFGAVGTMSAPMKEGLIILMQAAILKDENLMISGFKKMGFISDTPGVNRICKKIIRLLGDYLQHEIKLEKFNLNEIDIDQIDISKAIHLLKQIDLRELEDAMSIPKEWVLLNRTITLVVGVCSEIAPDIDTYKVIKPNMLKMLVQKENMGMILKTSLQQQALRLIALPRKIENFLEEAENGELEVKMRKRSLEIKLFYALFQQVFFLLCLVFSYFFYQSSGEHFFYYSTIVSGLLLSVAFLKSIFYKRRL